MAKLFDIMGNFPFKVEDKKPTLIRKSEYSTALYPPNNAFKIGRASCRERV